MCWPASVALDRMHYHLPMSVDQSTVKAREYGFFLKENENENLAEDAEDGD